MFSKAKLKRFNESVGCAPPPTKYNANVERKIQNVVFDKSGRFIEDKEPVCTFARSKSLRTVKQKDGKESGLESKIKDLTCEREVLKCRVEELEERMVNLKINDVKNLDKKELCKSSTQVGEILNVSNDLPQDLKGSSNCVSIAVPMEKYQLMKDELEHLTLLRDNLEKSIAKKEDLIADLHIHVDLMVGEAQEHQNNSIYFKEEVDKLLDKLNRTSEERKASQSKVAAMIKDYETIIRQHCNEELNYRDNIAAKDVKIELLNDSISILSTKLSEFGNHVAKIPNLEMRIGDLSIESKEKEVIGTILQSELNEKHTQMIKLEKSLLEVKLEVYSFKIEKDNVLALLSDEKQLREEMSSEIDQLLLQAKERDVLQQFLEKEISSREAEINAYSLRIQSLESDFESTQQLAMDMQQDAESQLNQIFCLKASLSAKEYDIEAKDDAIETLKERINKRCHEKFSVDDESKSSKVLQLEDDLHCAKEFMHCARQNTSQLEEKVIKLLSEIGEREEMHKKRILEKDSELEELSVKYSDALLEHDAIKRILSHSSQELEKEKLIIQATEMELKMVKNEFKNKVEQNKLMEGSIKEMALKLTHLEDALDCEEAESIVQQDQMNEKINHAEESLAKTKEELSSVMSSNAGFMAQITQLRIGMQKKCCAVDEMQGCIDALRQEKHELNSSYGEMKNSFIDKETLLADLEKEFEGKLKTITELQDQENLKDSEIMHKDEQIQDLNNKVAKLTLEIEEAESQSNLRIENAKSQWMKEQKLRIALEAKADEIQETLNALQEEKDQISDDMLSTLSQRQAKISELERNLCYLETKYEGYDDQIKNLQISLSDKTSEVDRFESSHNEINEVVESQQESSIKLNIHLKNLEDDQEYLNRTLREKDQMLSQLNHSMLLKSDKLHELQKEIGLKEKKIDALEETLCTVKRQLETSALEIASGHEKIFEIGDILQKKEDNELCLRYKMENINEQLFDLRVEQNIRETELQQISDSLQEEVISWKNKYEYLEKMIEPFKGQLSAYDLERAVLISESSAAQQEIDKLSRDYAKLLGHTNHKQKIQHVAKIKEENNQLKKEVQKLRQDIDNLRQAHRKLEELTGARQKTTFSSPSQGNKENCGGTIQDTSQGLSPLKSSNKLNRI